MPRQVTHICNKEADIAIIQTDIDYMKGKLDELHHKLLGNGKPGLLEEQNKRLTEVERKLVFYLGAAAVITFIITMFGTKIVTAIIG